jgi:Mg-chelatase subunit ChlD
MNEWASRRKMVYLAGAVLVLATIASLIFFKVWHEEPTCNDGMMNGDEKGIDCGGSCTLLCSSATIEPIVKWGPRYFEALPKVWSAIVYVENPNVDARAVYAPYTFTFYDERGTVIAKREGATVLPKAKTVGIFEGSISMDNNSKPKRAVFELGQRMVWQNDRGEESHLRITHTPILSLASSPRVEASVSNTGIEELNNIELIVSIFDGSDNTIAASRTFIDRLKRNETAQAFFTWPKPFDLGKKICEKPSNIMLVIDRSGSMASLGGNPPEPLNSTKEAASYFIEQVGSKDRVGVVSFATSAKEPIDAVLAADFESAKKAVESIMIDKSGTQYTNIFSAIRSSWAELVSPRALEEGANKVLILLTDGEANSPKSPNGKTEADDIKYAESLALSESESAKKEGMTIYTIGLGDKINDTFLKSVASGADKYFYAPSADSLKDIYRQISSEICEEVPARIEITHKVLGPI